MWQAWLIGILGIWVVVIAYLGLSSSTLTWVFGSYGHHHRDSGFLGHDEKDVIP